MINNAGPLGVVMASSLLFPSLPLPFLTVGLRIDDGEREIEEKKEREGGRKEGVGEKRKCERGKREGRLQEHKVDERVRREKKREKTKERGREKTNEKERGGRERERETEGRRGP